MSRDGVTKECRRCPCNDNEESCVTDTSSRVICKCKVGFSGEFCEGNAQVAYLIDVQLHFLYIRTFFTFFFPLLGDNFLILSLKIEQI